MSDWMGGRHIFASIGPSGQYTGRWQHSKVWNEEEDRVDRDRLLTSTNTATAGNATVGNALKGTRSSKGLLERRRARKALKHRLPNTPLEADGEHLPMVTWYSMITSYVNPSYYTLYTPFIHPLYTFIAVHTPMYTRYTCIHTIYTPNTPLNTL